MRIITSCIKRWPSMALWLMIMLLITVPLLILAINCPDSLQQSGIIISQYRTGCTLFRWSFLVVLFLIWPKMVRFYARKNTGHWRKLQSWIPGDFSYCYG